VRRGSPTEAVGTSYQYERRVLKSELSFCVSLILFMVMARQARTVTKERCFIDTPPRDALAERAMAPNNPCDCTNKCCLMLQGAPTRTNSARRSAERSKCSRNVRDPTAECCCSTVLQRQPSTALVALSDANLRNGLRGEPSNHVLTRFDHLRTLASAIRSHHVFSRLRAASHISARNSFAREFDRHQINTWNANYDTNAVYMPLLPIAKKYPPH
jgi:hypothetical protein